MATTNIFEVNHEDAYDSDVDEGPNAAAAFMANLSSISGTNGVTTRQVNEKELSREQVYWLPANEIASQASTPAKPVTPYVPKSLPPIKPLYVSLPCYEYAKEFALQQVVPFLDYFKKHVQTADDTIVKEVAEFKEIHYALEDEYERCVLDNKNMIIEKKNLLIKNDSLIAECLERIFALCALSAVLLPKF
ncbi:hypothetical protein Tco_0360901 [Tanacetum coccineum]